MQATTRAERRGSAYLPGFQDAEAVWGSKVRDCQTLFAGRQTLAPVDFDTSNYVAAPAFPG